MIEAAADQIVWSVDGGEPIRPRRDQDRNFVGNVVQAMVRYAEGELTGAAVLRTPGHLLALTGWQGDEVLVNDPAAPAAAVARRYRLDELARVWLERTGIGYVIFPLPDGRLRGG